jgi:hypothetical protein
MSMRQLTSFVRLEQKSIEVGKYNIFKGNYANEMSTSLRDIGDLDLIHGINAFISQ